MKPNGVITEYQLECFGGEQEYRWTVRGSQTTTTLSGLLPYTNYSCSITAHTSVGGGPAEVLTVQSDEDSMYIILYITFRLYMLVSLVPGKVKHVIIYIPANSVDRLVVLWDSPVRRNGVITGYELNVSRSTSTVYFASNINSHDSLRTVSNLSMLHYSTVLAFHYYMFAHCIGPYVPYYVSASAFTKKGRGETDQKIAFTHQGGIIQH